MPLNNTIDYIISINSEFSGWIINEYLGLVILVGLALSAAIFAASYKYKCHLLLPRNRGETVQDSLYMSMALSVAAAIVIVFVMLNIATVAAVGLILAIPIVALYCMFSGIMYIIDGSSVTRGESM